MNLDKHNAKKRIKVKPVNRPMQKHKNTLSCPTCKGALQEWGRKSPLTKIQGKVDPVTKKRGQDKVTLLTYGYGNEIEVFCDKDGCEYTGVRFP